MSFSLAAEWNKFEEHMHTGATLVEGWDGGKFIFFYLLPIIYS